RTSALRNRRGKRSTNCERIIPATHRLTCADGCATSRIFYVLSDDPSYFLARHIMTLTELKYIVAVARERHFGRAAEACFVSQPTLSVAIRKLEDELGVVLFERGGTEVGVTPLGLKIVEQAQRILEECANLVEMAKQGHDPLAGPLRVGVIHTIGPYLLPYLVPTQIKHTPQMPLLLQENFTDRLLELLRQGEIDCAIVALPLPDTGFAMQELYDEPFLVALPKSHPWANR